MPVYDATPDNIFTKPDTVKKAIEAAPLRRRRVAAAWRPDC